MNNPTILKIMEISKYQRGSGKIVREAYAIL